MASFDVITWVRLESFKISAYQSLEDFFAVSHFQAGRSLTVNFLVSIAKAHCEPNPWNPQKDISIWTTLSDLFFLKICVLFLLKLTECSKKFERFRQCEMSSPSSSFTEDWMASFGQYSSSETISELSKSIDLEFDPPEIRKISQARPIPPPLKLPMEAETKEESLVFDEDRLPTPSSPFFYGPRCNPQRSDESCCSTGISGSVASFRARFSTYSIDNSCFDLGALSGETSIVGTPVEKVFPKDNYGSILLEKVEKLKENLEEQKKELAQKTEFYLDNEITPKISAVISGEEEGGVGAKQLVSPTVEEQFPREEEVDKNGEVISSESSDEDQQNKAKTIEEALTLAPSPPSPLVVRHRGGRMSIRAVRKTKSVSETEFSFPSTSKRQPPKLDLVVGGPGAPPLPPSPPCNENFIFPTAKKKLRDEKEIKKAGKKLGNLRVIDVLKIKIVSLKGVRGATTRPLFLIAKLDQKDIYSSAPIYRETCEQFGEFIKWEGTFQTFRNFHLVILEGSRAPGKSPRPIGRIAMRRRELVNRSGEEMVLPLKVVSKFPDVQGQICLDLRRELDRFSLRVVDYSGLAIREPTELSLVVELRDFSKKLRIHAGRFSEEWLEIPCDPGPLQLKMTLWHELLRGLNSVFHGQVRVDVDERWSNGPSKWFYLRPRHSDQPEEVEEKTQEKRKAKDQLGEVRLVMTYTADHVLAAEHYKPLMDALAESLTAEPFSASLISVLENLPKIQVDLSVLSRPLVQTLAYSSHLRPLLISLYNTDLDRCQDMNTLFRSQSLASKMLNELMKLYGHSYLVITMKPVMDKIYKENKSCEIDPNRLGSGDNLEKNTNTLLAYFQQLFSRLVESATRCPEPIRYILNDLRKVVAQRTNRPEVERQAIASFVIMRFFAAALLSPKLFGLKNNNPEPRQTRTLTLLSKMLQRLANCCVSDQPLNMKEPWLMEILARVTDDSHKLAMVRFLDRISLHISDSSQSTESITVLKDGWLHETRGKQRSSRWINRLQQKKKRFIILTETDFYWQNSHRGVSLNPKGTIALHEITTITVENKNLLVIKTEREEHTFEAQTSSDANEWLTTIDRQRIVLKKQQSSKNELHSLIDNDLEREMESIHVILLDNIDLLTQWKSCLSSNVSAIEGVRALPVGLDGSLLEETVRQSHREALLVTLTNIIEITNAIEEVHSYAIKKFHNTMQKECGSGSKESPIGDDGYLLLKRQIQLRQH